MAPKKRKYDEEGPSDLEGAKKVSMDNKETEIAKAFYKVGISMGPEDGVITGLFSSLAFDIKNFTEDNFMGYPYRIPPRKEHQNFFNSLTSIGYYAYLKSTLSGPKENIVRAAIWNKLITKLLGAPTRAFLEMSEADYKKRFLDDLGGFCFWRALTAHNADKNDTGADRWAKDGPGREAFITETLAMIRSHAHIPNAENERKLARRLDEIAGKAYKLAKQMALSRAYWVCAMNFPQTEELHGFAMNPEWMKKENVVSGEAVDLGQDNNDSNEDQEVPSDGDEDWKPDEEDVAIVDLVICPMLLKFGNTSGKNYDSWHVAQKAHVITDPPAMPN